MFLFFILPICAALLLRIRAFKRSEACRRALVLAVFILLSLQFLRFVAASHSLPYVIVAGFWPHYAGIVWMIDGISLVFCIAVLVVYLPVAWVFCEAKNPNHLMFLHFLLGFSFGALLSGDFFNLFVMSELFLIASFAVFFSAETLKSARLYFWIQILGSGVFLLAIAFLYKTHATLNFADFSIRFPSQSEHTRDVLGSLFLFVFLLKAGSFPLLAGIPSAYSSLPTPWFAFLAAISAKLGIYAALRFLILTNGEFVHAHPIIFFVLGFLTALLGWIGALGSLTLRKRFLYFAISHIGFFLICTEAVFLAAGHYALAAILYFLPFDCLIIAGLVLSESDQKESDAEEDMTPFQMRWPLALLLLAGSGLPPFAAFWSELAALKGSVTSKFFFASLLLYGVCNLYVSARIWLLLFWETRPRKVRVEAIFCALACLFAVWMGIAHFDWYEEIGRRTKEPLILIKRFHDSSRQIEKVREGGR